MRTMQQESRHVQVIGKTKVRHMKRLSTALRKIVLHSRMRRWMTIKHFSAVCKHGS